jgi:ABC-type transport system substrate-binding protein
MKAFHKKSLAKLLGVVLVISCLLSACSGSTNSSSTNSDSESTSESTSGSNLMDAVIAENENTTEEITETGYIDEVNISMSGDLSDLSPWGTNNSNGRSYTVTTIYETLLTGDMEPCLAESYERVDNSTYNFTLYDYIYDTEGNHMTAEDVVFSVEKCLEIGSQPPVCNSVVGAEVLSEYTVQIKLRDNAGLGDIENVLANFFVVTQEAYENSSDGMRTTPVGTSHYALKSFTASASITLEDTENYWQTEELTAARSRANVKTINYYVQTESSQRVIALQNGSVDFAQVPLSDRATFANDDNYIVKDAMSGGAFVIIPNCSSDSPLNDVNLRKAVFYAIDNEACADGYSTGLAKAVVGVGSTYYSDFDEEYFSQEAADGNYYSYNPELAQQYLADAGYSAGQLTLRLYVQSAQQYTDEAAIIQAYLGNIGINVEITSLDNSIIVSYLEDSSAWDLYAVSYRGDASWCNITDKFFNPSYFATGYGINFIEDDTLMEKLELCRSYDGHTTENLNDYHDYIVENAYVMGLLATATSDVFSASKFSGGFVFQDSSAAAICAGACTFNG